MNPLSTPVNAHPIFLKYDVAAILENSPYKPSPVKLGEKVSRVAMGALRKIDLVRNNVTKTPIKNRVQHIYGHSPLSKLAIEYKKKHNVTAGRNVAIILFEKTSGQLAYTIAATSGPPGSCPHSELQALDKLPKALNFDTKTVKVIYTEREPCANCDGKIKSVFGKNVNIIYNISYSQDRTLQSQVEQAFQASQAAHGIRRARTRTKKPVAKALNSKNALKVKIVDPKTVNFQKRTQHLKKAKTQRKLF